jgi:hypothetical protein
LGSGVDLTKGLLDNVRTFAASSWTGLTGLAHGTSSTYFIVASGTNLFAVPGAEGVLGNDVQNGLVGHWGFDEGTGTITYDESGNGNNGTLVNGPTWQSGSNCIVGNCLSFNASSSQYVSLPNVSALNFTSNGMFSIAVWVDPNTLSSAWRRGIIVQENYLNSGFRFGFSNGGAPMLWTTQSGGTLQLTSSQLLSINQWNYLVVTYNNQQAYMYLNGIQVASSSGTYVAGTNVPKIGYGVNEYFSGLIDDVRYYNRALSATEVKQLYNSQAFSRYFYVQDVCRTNDASSSIVGNPPCSGNNWDDPLTQQVTAVTQWLAGAATDNTSLTTYLTDYRNFTLRQTDWSGGSGQTGPLTIPNTQYASGTNVTGTSTLGSFQIQNLTQQ